MIVSVVFSFDSYPTSLLFKGVNAEYSFNKKERRKAGEKERIKMILPFRHQAVSNSGDTAARVKHRNSFGSAQEYLLSIYISKTNL